MKIPRLIPVFKGVRADEAERATNDAFKLICIRRVSSKKYREAFERFLYAFEQARKESYEKINK
jgi:hypothetical protein